MVGKKENIIKVYYPEQNYSVIFNKSTGFFARIEEKGFDEPFWSKASPELLDISITNYCEKNCNFCYRNSNKYGKHIKLDDYNNIIKQAQELGVFQIAIGGGNPNQHPDFIEILKNTYDAGIVPSYTSNGDGLTNEILKATEKYCGAMAISAYKPFHKLDNIIKRVKKFEIKLNLHFVLDKYSIKDAIKWLDNPPDFLSEINAIIFLNYKPVNSSNELLLNKSNDLKLFFELVDQKFPFKIGFDSCSVSGIVQHMDINPMYYESCEAAKFSAFISEDLKMYPCSFMVNTNMYGDLKEKSIKEIWQKDKSFVEFRNKIKNNNCKACKFESICQGGCQFLPEINLCNMENLIKYDAPTQHIHNGG